MKHLGYIYYSLITLCVITFLTILLIDSDSSFAFTHADGSVSDSYYIASFAKNIATGNGWRTWDGSSWLPLDLHISTGPIVFLPLAAFLLLGVSPETSIPYAALAINGALLLLLLRQWAKLIPIDRLLPIVVLALLFFLCFQRQQWYLCLGETACVLLLLISISYLAIDAYSLKSLALAGVAAGAAMSAKLLGIFAVITVPVYLMFSSTWKEQSWIKKTALTTSWISGALCIPLFTVLMLLYFHPIDTLWEKITDYLDLYFTKHGNIPYNPEKWLNRSVYELPYWNFLNLKSAFSATISGISLFLLSTLPVAIASKPTDRQSKIECLIGLISFMAIIYIVWFYFLGLHQQARYFYIGGSLSFIALAMTISRIKKQWPHKIGMLALVAITASLGSPWAWTDKGNTYVSDMKNMARTINQQENLKEIVWIPQGNHPWPFLSYYLKSSVRWLHLSRVLAEYSTFDQSQYLLQLNETERNTLKASQMSTEHFFFTNLGNHDKTGHFNWKSKDRVFALLAKTNEKNTNKPQINCSHHIAENNSFILAKCSPKEIEAAILKLIGSHKIIINEYPSNAPH
ncbi:MAG: hypothetical protein R3E61_11715 [Pseudomonadales bacterium]